MMFETSVDAGNARRPAFDAARRRAARRSHLAELSSSTLPPMLLLLLLSAGEREGAEPLGHAIGCLGALHEYISAGGVKTPETRKLGREAIGALFTAVKTLRQEDS